MHNTLISDNLKPIPNSNKAVYSVSIWLNLENDTTSNLRYMYYETMHTKLPEVFTSYKKMIDYHNELNTETSQ